MVPFPRAGREAGVRRAVLLSNSAIPSADGTGAVHQAIAAMFDEWAVLRPSWFMQNVTATTCMPKHRTSATITTATGTARRLRGSYDIAPIAVEALLSPTAAEYRSDPDRTRSAELRRRGSHPHRRQRLPITHVHVSVADLRALYETAGLPSASPSSWRHRIMPLLRIEDRTTDTVERVTGVSPRSFREFGRRRVSDLIREERPWPSRNALTPHETDRRSHRASTLFAAVTIR